MRNLLHECRRLITRAGTGCYSAYNYCWVLWFTGMLYVRQEGTRLNPDNHIDELNKCAGHDLGFTDELLLRSYAATRAAGPGERDDHIDDYSKDRVNSPFSKTNGDSEMTASTTGSGILAILEDDALLAVGSPLINLITALKAANNDPLKDMAAWLQFQGNLAPSLLTFESTIAGQILTAINNKLTAALSKAQSGLSAAIPTALPAV